MTQQQKANIDCNTAVFYLGQNARKLIFNPTCTYYFVTQLAEYFSKSSLILYTSHVPLAGSATFLSFYFFAYKVGTIA